VGNVIDTELYNEIAERDNAPNRAALPEPFTASQDFRGAWQVVDSVRRVPELLAT
jgi:hypothetical protein